MSVTSNSPDLTLGIPRGLTGKYLKDQSIPQARWQPQEQVEVHEKLAYDPANPQGKILFGAIGSKLIGYADNRHIMTVAGNRSGKSVTLKANLFFYDGSALIIDPKGELACDTASHRAAMGQDVFVLDPFEIVSGDAAQFRAQYNELETLDIESETVIEDAMQVVDGQIVSSGRENDPHWNEAAGGAMLGLVLFAKFGQGLKPHQRNMIMVRKMINDAMKQEIIHDDVPSEGIEGAQELPQGKAVYSLPHQIMRGIEHLRNTPNEDIAEAIEASVTGLYDKSPDEMASVLSTMKRHTAYLDFRSMRKIRQGHDFDLRDLKRKKNGVTIYVCLPATRMGSCKRWMRVIINQLIEAMEKETAIPDVPVLAALDEFPVLGFMQTLQDAAGQIASFGLRMWYIAQDWGQCEAIYEKRWESFAANCGVNQWFANTDLKTCEYVSKRLGKTPVLSMREGDTSYEQRDKGLSGQSASKQLYDLLTPDEVARTFARSDPLKRQIIHIAGLDPVILQRIEYWDEKAAYASHFALFKSQGNYSVASS
ncbi:type IV secretory system conjugative DNA transfer family protein [Parasphingorhabdus flavimaris]|uniref:type IV secretory system conjugative DNA transfer family protein n=1 Tax=Parasphingorhabdus flavimaris TaxID=266812 RepID=UPI003002BF05